MGEYVLEVDEMMEDIFFSVKLKEEGKKKLRKRIMKVDIGEWFIKKNPLKKVCLLA